MKCYKMKTHQLAFVALFGAICTVAHAAGVRHKRQAGSAVVDTNEDHQPAESALDGYTSSSNKYFQYTHVPAKDHYEFGHKRGNDHHFIEKHEKAHPHAGHFNTKVRWGDKHGGYGEHYWDFNHAGHTDDIHDESRHEPEYVAYDESNPEPVYAAAEPSNESVKYVAPPGDAATKRAKREPVDVDLNDEVEFIDDRARSLILSGATGKHGGNYKKAPAYERGKREGGFGVRQIDGRNLVFQQDTGLVVDESTGIAYRLQPVEY